MQRKKKAPAKMGRPKKDIDFTVVDKLCGLQCTGEEIASFLDVDYDTLCRRCVSEKGKTFAEYFDQKRKIGKVSLRRHQFQAASNLNSTMLIWLGKQFLGQRDQLDLDLSGGVEVHTDNINLKKLSQKELDELERITRKATENK
jgi:hypothetical protein